jgi:hypothetical protein
MSTNAQFSIRRRADLLEPSVFPRIKIKIEDSPFSDPSTLKRTLPVDEKANDWLDSSVQQPKEAYRMRRSKQDRAMTMESDGETSARESLKVVPSTDYDWDTKRVSRFYSVSSIPFSPLAPKYAPSFEDAVDSETESQNEQRKMAPLPLDGIPSGAQQRFIRVDSSQPHEVRNNKETPLKECAEFNMKPQEPNGMFPTESKSHEQDAKTPPLLVRRWEPYDDGAGASPLLTARRVQPARAESLHNRNNAVNEMVDSEERRHEQGKMAHLAPTGIPSRFLQLGFICAPSPEDAKPSAYVLD